MNERIKLKSQPQIAERLFWDVKVEVLDFEKDRLYVIDRVMNYGGWNDFLEVLRFYGAEVIRTEIVRSSYLKKDVLNFICFYFDLKPTDFKCYTRRQSHRELWDF